jgi:hypothetical protein
MIVDQINSSSGGSQVATGVTVTNVDKSTNYSNFRLSTDRLRWNW